MQILDLFINIVRFIVANFAIVGTFGLAISSGIVLLKALNRFYS